MNFADAALVLAVLAVCCVAPIAAVVAVRLVIDGRARREDAGPWVAPDRSRPEVRR